MNQKLRSERKFAHTRHIPVAQAIRNRKNHISNLWIFDSPKNDKRFVIQGDVAFMHFILMEGDPKITRYDPNPSPVFASIDGEVRQTQLDAHVYFNDGHVEWWEFKRSGDAGADRTGRARPQLSAQAQAASAAGVPYRIKTELDLRGREIEFDNWLLLCAAITRARNQPMSREARIFHTRIETHRQVTVGSLLEEPECDAALMLAILAKALQRGVISSNLAKEFLARRSVVSKGAQHG